MELGDVSLGYEVRGMGEPVVLVTGLGGDTSFWNGLIRLLEGHTVIAIDNRGAGRTECPPAFSIGDMADDVVALLDHLGIERAHVVGWSMGGNVAQETAICHPERVGSLTLMSTYVRRPARSSHAIDTMIRAVREGASLQCFNLLMQSYCLTEGAFRRWEGDGRSDDRGPECDIEKIAAQKRALDAFDSSERVSGIASPTLVLHGEEDIMVPPCMGRELADSIAGSSFRLVEGEGHIMRPSSYADHLLTHIDARPLR